MWWRYFRLVCGARLSAASLQAEVVSHTDTVSASMRLILRAAKAQGRWDGDPQTAIDILAASTSFSIAELIEYGHDAALAVQS